MTTIQPNKTFADEAEMHQWLAVNIPGAKILRTWKVEQICCEVEYKPVDSRLPVVCEATNCFRFETQKEMNAFNDTQCGHLQILASWRCRACNGSWHMWCLTAHSNSDGKLPAGQKAEVPQRIKDMIERTRMAF